MSGLQQMAKPKPKQEPTVAEVVGGFLADVEGRAKPNTSEVYRYYLLPFAQKYGKAKPSELTPTLAEAYSRKPTWGNTTRHDCLGTLSSMFKWAERAALIDKAPLQGLKRPPSRLQRGRSGHQPRRTTQGSWRRQGSGLKPSCGGCTLPGARPGEVAAITAENFDEANVLRAAERPQDGPQGQEPNHLPVPRSRGPPSRAKGDVRLRLSVPLTLRSAVEWQRRRQGDDPVAEAGGAGQRPSPTATATPSPPKPWRTACPTPRWPSCLGTAARRCFINIIPT